MLTCQRHHFSLPEGEHYLNCAYMGPLPRSTEAAGAQGVRRKSVPYSITPPDFFTGPEQLRSQLARLVHAPVDAVALIPAVSYGMAIATCNTSLRPADNVVMPGEEFPSDVYGWMDACAQAGAELRLVPRPEETEHAGVLWNERLLDAIDGNTAVVALTAAHWTDGTTFDLEAIGQRAREVGALFLVDGTQSVGALPFDFAAVRPDLLVCAGYKFLLGPYQLGFAALGPRLLAGRPFEMNWLNRERSEDFARLIDYREGYQHGARRFDVGERSNPITVPMLAESVRLILDWGVDNIQAYCEELGRVLADALGEDAGFTLNPAGECGAHLFGVRVPRPEAIPAILKQLAARKVYVSQRGNAVRVAPNVYNTAEDMVALAEALRAAMK